MKTLLYFCATVCIIYSCADAPKKVDNPHVVFVTGDEEYRSEESMPMLAKILKREMGAEISICYALDSMGIIDPNRSDNIAGLEALESADLMVMFTRFRELPKHQAKLITDYAESGKPMVGFRTSTHAFMYETDSSMMHLNNDWPASVFGQQWIVHHGHFEDGHGALTSIDLLDSVSPIINGVEPFDAYSWLYHVDGGEWKLNGDYQLLLEGTSLRSKQEAAGKLDLYPMTNPVAWTKSYQGNTGQSPARVFFTTLGHPYDFKIESMRKLALNGIYWALQREEDIPKNGVNADFADDYNPNNSGFGQKFKKGMKPLQIK